MLKCLSYRIDFPDSRKNANIADEMATVDKSTCYKLYFIYLIRTFQSYTLLGTAEVWALLSLKRLLHKQDTIAVHCDYAEAVYVHDPIC